MGFDVMMAVSGLIGLGGLFVGLVLLPMGVRQPCPFARVRLREEREALQRADANWAFDRVG